MTSNPILYTRSMRYKWMCIWRRVFPIQHPHGWYYCVRFSLLRNYVCSLSRAAWMVCEVVVMMIIFSYIKCTPTNWWQREYLLDVVVLCCATCFIDEMPTNWLASRWVCLIWRPMFCRHLNSGHFIHVLYIILYSDKLQIFLCFKLLIVRTQ